MNISVTITHSSHGIVRGRVWCTGLGGYEKREFVAEFYDLLYKSRQDVDFFISYSRQVTGRTLELGCGTGRILIPIALSGCEITGLEVSSYMLGKCQEKLAKQNKQVQERVKLIQGNMTHFETGESYALVMIPFRSFQHLISIKEQSSCLKYAYNHLIRHGLFILDLQNIAGVRMYHPKYTMEQELLASQKLNDGRSIRCTTRISAFHRNQKYNDIEIIHYISDPDGVEKRLVQAFPMRYYYKDEVEQLLQICGFRVIEIYGDYDGSEYTQNSPEMIFVAEKEKRSYDDSLSSFVCNMNNSD